MSRQRVERSAHRGRPPRSRRRPRTKRRRGQPWFLPPRPARRRRRARRGRDNLASPARCVEHPRSGSNQPGWARIWASSRHTSPSLRLPQGRVRLAERDDPGVDCIGRVLGQGGAIARPTALETRRSGIAESRRRPARCGRVTASGPDHATRPGAPASRNDTSGSAGSPGVVAPRRRAPACRLRRAGLRPRVRRRLHASRLGITDAPAARLVVRAPGCGRPPPGGRRGVPSPAHRGLGVGDPQLGLPLGLAQSEEVSRLHGLPRTLSSRADAAWRRRRSVSSRSFVRLKARRRGAHGWDQLPCGRRGEGGWDSARRSSLRALIEGRREGLEAAVYLQSPRLIMHAWASTPFSLVPLLYHKRNGSRVHFWLRDLGRSDRPVGSVPAVAAPRPACQDANAANCSDCTSSSITSARPASSVRSRSYTTWVRLSPR